MPRKRRRFQDSRKAIAKPIFDGWKIRDGGQRHATRLDFNLDYADEVRRWCWDRGVTLSIRNSGHHWIFTAANMLAEWWPSSAKLVLNKQWKGGIHVHDWHQLIEELAVIFVGTKEDSIPFAFNSI